jgi:hypothetical protein
MRLFTTAYGFHSAIFALLRLTGGNIVVHSCHFLLAENSIKHVCFVFVTFTVLKVVIISFIALHNKISAHATNKC